MSITRVDPVANTATRYRRQLGRVRVTVDDLAALVTALVELGEPADEIRLNFDGGTFDSPDDLRMLSDLELLSVQVTSPRVEIVLSRTRAEAVGSHELSQGVYRMWARPRQTRHLPPGYFTMGSTVGGLLLVIALTAGLAYLVFPSIGMIGDATDSTDSVWGVVALCVLTGGLALMGVSLRHLLRGGTSYAVVVPMSVEEYRLNR